MIPPLAGAALLAGIGACSKSPDAPASASPSPSPPAANTIAPILAPAPTPPAAVDGNASPTPSPDDASSDDAEVPVAVLQQKYFATQDEDDRTEIISQIGDKDDLSGIQTLTRIFAAEPSNDLRSQLLSVAADMGDDDEQPVKDAKLQLYTTALSGGQNDDVRETAVDGLEQLDDPRTLSLWQRLLSDPDEDIRDSAQAAIERYKEKAQ